MNQSRSIEPAPGSQARAEIDDADRAIMEMLAKDGRTSYAELGKSVGLSPPAARLRVQRLRNLELLRIIGVADASALGMKRIALIGLEIEGDIRVVAEQIAAVPEVVYVVICAGSFDLLVEIICEDDNSLIRLLNDVIRAIPGVRRTETFMYLQLIKQNYSWGARA